VNTPSGRSKDPKKVEPDEAIAQQEQSSLMRPLDLLDIYIDMKDTTNKWCVAKIIEHDISTYRISVNFDGWTERYNETERTGSSRLAPFRKYTRGYTGATRTA